MDTNSWRKAHVVIHNIKIEHKVFVNNFKITLNLTVTRKISKHAGPHGFIRSRRKIWSDEKDLPLK